MILLPMTIESVSNALEVVVKCFLRLTLHDVVTVCDETNANSESNDSDLPERDRNLLVTSLTSAPSFVHSRPDTDGITNIVGTVSEGSSASGEDLEEGEKVLGIVGILASTGMNLGDSLSGRLSLFSLQSVNVDGGTVSESLVDGGERAVTDDNPQIFWEDPGSFDRVSLYFARKVAGLGSRGGSLLNIRSLILLVALL